MDIGEEVTTIIVEPMPVEEPKKETVPEPVRTPDLVPA